MEWNIHRLDTCPSTMDEARRLAVEGAPHGTVVVAKAMTAGRGQHGNAWHAPAGGLYLSMVLREIPAGDVLTLALGNAVADVLEVAGIDAAIKWVNDVMASDRKIAGILCEAETKGNDTVVVAGIGLNVHGDVGGWPEPLCNTATTMATELGVEDCDEDLEEYLLDTIGQWLTKDAGDVVEATRQRDWLHGRTVEVDGREGKAAGIDDDGALLIETSTGMHRVRTGTVSVAA